MPTTTPRPAIDAATFAWLAAGILAITIFVIAVLYRDYELDLSAVVGVTIDPIINLFAIGFILYLLQRKASAAYGGGRLADLLVSMPMLIVAGLAVFLWAEIPLVKGIVSTISTGTGIPIASTPNTYKRVAVGIFGVVALWDVLIRDLVGYGRQSGHFRWPFGAGVSSDVRREDLVSGAHGDLPDRTTVIGSRSGSPEIENRIPIRHVFEHYLYDPRTGRDVLIPYAPTPRSAIRVAETLGPPAPPAAQEAGGADARAS